MAITETASAKKRVQGPDKQPRRKKTQTEKGKRENITAETIEGPKSTAERQRGLKALQEALIDKDIENDNW